MQYPHVSQLITHMVKAQFSLNKNSYSDKWLELGGLPDSAPEVWDYPLAAAMEIGEFLNSWSYSWWATKVWPIKQAEDRQNCLTELVDAWHFIMSQAIIEEAGDVDRASVALLEGYHRAQSSGVGNSHREVTCVAKSLMSMLVDYENHPSITSLPDVYAKFFTLLGAAGFGFTHFCARYDAKLQLNIFRTLNGYKDKPRTYVKLWKDGKEDNEYLSLYIDETFTKTGKAPDNQEIMMWIARAYAKFTGLSARTPKIDLDEKVATNE